MDNNADILQRKRALSLDGVRSRPLVPAAARQQARPRTYFQPRPAPKQHRLWQRAQLPILLLGGSAGGFFADNLVLGLPLIAAYGLYAFLGRLSSRTTFTLTFLLIGAISLMLLIKPNTQLIRNFATYAFVLVLIGVVTLGRESRLPKRMRRKYRR